MPASGKPRCGAVTLGQRQQWAVRVDRHQGRSSRVACQTSETHPVLTFTRRTAASRLGAHFYQCCAMHKRPVFKKLSKTKQNQTEFCQEVIAQEYSVIPNVVPPVTKTGRLWPAMQLQTPKSVIWMRTRRDLCYLRRNLWAKGIAKGRLGRQHALNHSYLGKTG